MKRVTFLNAFSGAAQVVLNAVLVLATVPVFIGRLGLPTYSIYALVTAVGGFGVFTNFGFNTSLIKYLAEQKNREESNYDIAVVLTILAGSTVLTAILSIVMSDFVLSRVLNLGSDVLTPVVRWFYVACVGSTVCQVISQVPAAILDSQLRVYVTNGVQLTMGVLSRVLILVSLLIQPNLLTVGWIMLGSSFVGLVTLGWFALRIWGRVSCPSFRDRFFITARKHFSYGRTIYATAVVGFFYEPLTKVLISHWAGLTEVGFFDMALRIKGIVWSVMERFLYPVLPMFASKSKRDDIRDLMEEAQRKLVVVVVPAAIVTVFLSQPLVTVWLGTTRWPVIVSVMGIVPCYLLALLFVPLYHFLAIKGHPQKTLVLQSVNVGVNVILFLSLVTRFGYYGALCSYCLAVLASSGLAAWYQSTLLGSTPLRSEDGIRVLKLGLFLTLLNVALTPISQDLWARILLTLFLNAAAVILLFRWLRLITIGDVERYIGRNNRFGLILEKLLVQELPS